MIDPWALWTDQSCSGSRPKDFLALFAIARDKDALIKDTMVNNCISPLLWDINLYGTWTIGRLLIWSLSLLFLILAFLTLRFVIVVYSYAQKMFYSLWDLFVLTCLKIMSLKVPVGADLKEKKTSPCVAFLAWEAVWDKSLTTMIWGSNEERSSLMGTCWVCKRANPLIKSPSSVCGG